MIKLISYLLAFYTLILSCIPCQDEVLVSLQNPYPSEFTTTAHSDRSGDGSVDLCSPFCICACCAAVTLLAAPCALPEDVAQVFGQHALFFYKSDFANGDLSVIWQPPRYLV